MYLLIFKCWFCYSKIKKLVTSTFQAHKNRRQPCQSSSGTFEELLKKLTFLLGHESESLKVLVYVRLHRQIKLLAGGSRHETRGVNLVTQFVSWTPKQETIVLILFIYLVDLIHTDATKCASQNTIRKAKYFEIILIKKKTKIFVSR